MRSIIEFFSKKHLLTNIVFIAVIISGMIFWQMTPKEELPDISFDFIRISTNYPGAGASDVEYFVTRPLEESIQGIDGIYSIMSDTSVGVSSIVVEIEQNRSDRDSIISEIKTAVLDVSMPDAVRDEPKFREFKTSQKAIIDVYLYDTEHHMLNYETRLDLQKTISVLESQLISQKYVSSVNLAGNLKQEIQIQIDSQKCQEYKIPINKVISEIQKNHILVPAGSLEDKKESKVTIRAELSDVTIIENLIIQGGFNGNSVRLNDIATIKRAFEKNKSITKINGYEAVGLSVVKSSSAGILDAVDNVKNYVVSFSENSLKGSSKKLVLLDDESTDVRNRIQLIVANGAFGFALIIITLFVFINFKSSVWVALGIPFSFCFTMIIASVMGYSINNITLAAVIIVMGMIVDDAIVIAENISRLQREGMDKKEAAVKGTMYMVGPVVASVLTTCVAFFPLANFDGKFGSMINVIPIIVILMLIGSLLESIIILPSHMVLDIPLLKKNKVEKNSHWFASIENLYGSFLKKILKIKYLAIAFFIFLILFSVKIFNENMKFVMFPNEETTEITLMAMAPKGTKRLQTAEYSRQLESIISEYVGEEVVGFRSYVARSRRGGEVKENQLLMKIEVLPKDNREKSLSILIKEWKQAFQDVKVFNDIKFSKQRFGQSGGSPFEIIIQEDNDKIRAEAVKDIIKEFSLHPFLINVEEEEPVKSPEYIVSLNRDKIKKLGIDISSIGTTLRGALEGIILFELREDEDELDVRLSIDNTQKRTIDDVMNIPVANDSNYLVPLKDLVSVKKELNPDSIHRDELHRTTKVYADLKDNSDASVIEIAEFYEKGFFNKLKKDYPSSVFTFKGEVKDTRDSGSQLSISIMLAVTLIYIVLVLLFNSLVKPLIIMLSIPFGIVGVIFAFYLHGITEFGFFAAVGIIGLSGVVVNDSIVMLVKLDRELKLEKKTRDNIAEIAKTRLLAVLLTTVTTVVGLFPTAYGWAGYDYMLSQMMLAMGWGLICATAITLVLIPCLYSILYDFKKIFVKGIQ